MPDKLIEKTRSNTNAGVGVRSKADSLGAFEGLKPRRAESLATRGDVDFMALINDAKKVCKIPIKLSFKNVCFEVSEKSNALEKQ